MLTDSTLYRNSTFFFFNDTATTEIYTLSLHDALPIYHGGLGHQVGLGHQGRLDLHRATAWARWRSSRSVEHTSELQSPCNLVCRLLLEKKKVRIQVYSSALMSYVALVLQLSIFNDLVT